MGYLRGYEFVNINRNINNYLKLSKKIRFLFNCWNPIKDNETYLHQELTLIIDKESFKISKEVLNIKSDILSKQENEKLNNYLKKYGPKLLDYELRKINFQDLNI